MFFLISCILNLIAATTCSIVFDRANQNAIYIKDYCPKMEHCPEGTHVLCMYHDAVNVMGPRCNNGQNITMTEQFKDMLLDMINEIRSSAAKGNEVGKDGQLLPRAYGMHRLEWDMELATFAQIWANQCTLNHDLCRATKKFPNPGQVAGIIRFTYPGWEILNDPVPDRARRTEEDHNVSQASVLYALNKTIKNSYDRKDLVTRDMILHYPDMVAEKELFKARVYLTMIHGFSTHIGCGISSYIAYHGFISAPVIFNAVELVCNFSGQPEEGKKVFETEPLPGGTMTCGCPPGFDEDSDCLCVKSERRNEKTCNLGDGRCEPAVVLLPIITVEDAPPEKLFHAGSGNITGIRRDNSFEIFNIVHPQANYFYSTVKPAFLVQSSSVIASPPRINMSPARMNMSPARMNMSPARMNMSPARMNMSPARMNMSPPRIDLPQSRLNMASSQLNKRIGAMDNNRFKGVRKRYFNKKAVIPGKSYQAGVSPERRAGHVQQNRISPFVKKESIFTRATKFQLPAQNSDRRAISTNNSQRWKPNAIKKDVTPRKDFSKVQGLMSAYLNKKFGDNAIKPVSFIVTTAKYEKHVENLLASVVPRHQKFGIQNFNGTSLFKKFDIKNSNEETDTKLLSLLDNLEQEVRHIDLKKNVKEMFDAKIRQIYGNVLGDPDLLNNTPMEVVDELLAKIERKTNSPLYGEGDHRNIDTPIRNFESGRPLKRSQNSIVQYEKPNYEHYRSKYSIFNKNDRDTSYGMDPGKDETQRDVKTDNSFKENSYYNNYANGQDKYKNLERMKTRNYYLNDEEDPLGTDRRKFYQEKLDKLERRLQNVRGGYRRQNEIKDNSRLVRPVLNPRKDLEQRPVNHPQNFYLPDRAKFLHGF
ncbi:uncharacterized protein isoform X2 [Choristoneura fumiferana]|uniref:uncharacterized protein isoform X2 n=1 Tax=Choristoneura fumiferana TaxID=7141 RepID=UPI003D15D00D